jgi:hypothetical protein
MRRDINDLQKKTVTKDELQEMRDSMEANMHSMEAKLMDSMEAKLDTKMDSMEDKLDTNMDSMEAKIMEVMKNFVTEKTPKSENSSHEIHDEDTRKVNKNGETPTLV